jgi:hypothetical protein
VGRLPDIPAGSLASVYAANGSTPVVTGQLGGTSPASAVNGSASTVTDPRDGQAGVHQHTQSLAGVRGG